LSFEDDRAPEAQDPLGDDAVRIAIAAGAALASRRCLLRDTRDRCEHEQADERRVSKRSDHHIVLDPRDSSPKA
jgi:hypothetical protein